MRDLPSERLSHAWNWFDVHSKQRMQAVNFFLIIQVGMLAVVGSMIKEKQGFFVALLGLVVVLFALLFLLIDLRSKELTKIGERALAAEEAALAGDSAEYIELVKSSDDLGRKGVTYGRLFKVMFGLFALMGAVICGYGMGFVAN